MLQAFLKNSLVYTLGQVLTSGIVIFLLPVYTRYLSPSEYGIIDLFIIITALVNLTIALQISEGIARYFQEAKNEKEKREYTSSAFWFTVFVFLIFFLLTYIFCDTLTLWLLGDVNQKELFLLATFSVVTNGIFYFTKNQLRWQIQPRNSVIISFLNIILIATISVYLLIIEGLKLESIFIGQIVGNIIASIVAIFYARKSYGLTFSVTKFKKMVSYSMPLVLSSIGVFLSLYIDRIAIKDLLGLNELGTYGVAYRFAAVAFLVITGFQQSLSPLVFKNYKKKVTPINISKILNIFTIFALFTISGSILFAKELVILFTTKAFYSSSSFISILVMAIFFSKMYIFAPGMSIAKKTKLISMISIISAILNVILNYTLIPIFGLSGAAYATLISSIITFSLYIFISQKYYPVPYQAKTILVVFFVVLIISYGIVSMLDEIQLIFITIKTVFLLLMLIGSLYILLDKDHFQKIKIKISEKILK